MNRKDRQLKRHKRRARKESQHMCTRKQHYATEAEAQPHVERLNAVRKHQSHAYLCPYCMRWHVGRIR